MESLPVFVFLINFNCIQVNTGRPEAVMFGSVGVLMRNLA